MPGLSAAEFKWRDFRSVWILILSPCKTPLVLVSLEDGFSRDCVSSGCLERHLTTLLTKLKWKLTGLSLLPCEQGVRFPPLSLWGIRLYIFSCKKLVFRKSSGVNQCIFVGCSGTTSIHMTDVSGLLPSETWKAGLFIPKCWPSPLLMFSVTSKENKCKYCSDWVVHTSGKSEVLSMRVTLLRSYFMLCCLFPALRSHVPPRAFLWLFSPMEMPSLRALDPCGPSPPPRSSVQEFHVLGAGGAWKVPICIFLIANTERIITEFTHRLLINTHTHLLEEKMS